MFPHLCRWVQWWRRVRHAEQSAPLPAVSDNSENSLTTHTSLWFQRSDKIALKNGKFGKAQLYFDISCWFKMPTHRESKTMKIGELQCNSCQGKCKHHEVCRLRLQLEISQFFLPVYQDLYSWGGWRGNGTRVASFMCTQWMVHRELPLLHSEGGESIMPKRDGRCRKNVNLSVKWVLKGQLSRLEGFRQCLMNTLLHSHYTLLLLDICG